MKYVLLFICILAGSCHLKSAKQDDSNLIKSYPEPKHEPEIWTEYVTKDSIPKILLKRLDSLTDGKFEIANPKDNFQSTDVVLNNKLPWRQLRFLGKSANVWIMTYKHGGIGLHYHFVTCKIINNEIVLFRTGVSLSDLDTIAQIKKALSDQIIEFKNIDLKEEIDKV